MSERQLGIPLGCIPLDTRKASTSWPWGCSPWGVAVLPPLNQSFLSILLKYSPPFQTVDCCRSACSNRFELSLCSPSHSGRGGASRLYLSVHRSVCLGLVELIREEPVLVFLASSALLSTSGGFVGNRIMRDQTTSSTPTVRP